MMLAISSLFLGCRNIVLQFSFARQSEQCFQEYFMFFFSFSCRSKLIIKDVNNITGTDYGITIIKGEYNYYTGSYSFQRNTRFDSFPCALNIIHICSKIFIIICLFTSLHKGEEQISIFFVFSVKDSSSFRTGAFLLIKFAKNQFFTDIDFCKPKVIQGLDFNFNLYLSILVLSVHNNILILSKYIQLELSAFSSSIFKKSSQLTEKLLRGTKFSQPNFHTLS